MTYNLPKNTFAQRRMDWTIFSLSLNPNLPLKERRRYYLKQMVLKSLELLKKGSFSPATNGGQISLFWRTGTAQCSLSNPFCLLLFFFGFVQVLNNWGHVHLVEFTRQFFILITVLYFPDLTNEFIYSSFGSRNYTKRWDAHSGLRPFFLLKSSGSLNG